MAWIPLPMPSHPALKQSKQTLHVEPIKPHEQHQPDGTVPLTALILGSIIYFYLSWKDRPGKKDTD